jgi:hypothetical protein
MKTAAKNKVIKKLVTFTQEEWDFIQSYKHANKLKTDIQAIKEPIMEKKSMKEKAFNNFFNSENNKKILKKLANK